MVGLLSSAPSSEGTEKHVLEILALIGDNVASAVRLRELIEAREAASRVVADLNASTAEANAALSAAAAEKDEAAKVAKATAEGAALLAQDRAEFNALVSTWKATLREREEAVSRRETLVDRKDRDATALAAAAESAKTKYEAALANLRAAIPSQE